MINTIEAKITWNTEDHGCIESPFSGIQPSLAVAGELIMSRVECKDGTKKMKRGHCYDVIITLSYGQRYKAHLLPGMDVRLQVGERIIATGSVTNVRGLP